MSKLRGIDLRSASLAYLGCVLLIPVYVNMFSVWQIANSTLNKQVLAMLPIILTVAVLLLCWLLFLNRRQNTGVTINRKAVLAGIAICLVALCIPDPRYAVKRIHVAEYLLLSLIARFAMSFRLQGLPLLLFSAGFAALLGIHDEFLQGIHPSRTYGLRDMTVNLLGAAGGALIWHGMQLFYRQHTARPVAASSPHITLVYCGWLIVSVIAYVFPLVFYRSISLPLWPALPLMAAMVYLAIYSNRFHYYTHGVMAMSIPAFSLLVYPFVSYVPEIVFY